MVVETRYAAGDGVLLGAGDHWVLVTDPRDDDVLDEIWAVVSRRPAGHRLGDRGGPRRPGEGLRGRPAGAGRGRPVLRRLRQRLAGPRPRARAWAPTASSPSTAAPTPAASPRPGASWPAWSPPPAPRSGRWPTGWRRPRRAGRARRRPPAPGMIDGIPAAILAATGPEGPPPPRPRRVAEPAPASEDTGSLHDTTEPDPAFMERIHEGGHTTIQPPASGRGRREPEADDHDGSTVHRPGTGPAPAARHPRDGAGGELPAGPPDVAVAARRAGCATSGSRRRSRAGCRVPRSAACACPPGRSCRSTGAWCSAASPPRSRAAGDWPHLVHLPSDHTFVSRMHLHIELDGWQVLARDLDSRGGTMLTMPGREPERMRAGEAYVLEPGCSPRPRRGLRGPLRGRLRRPRTVSGR